MSIAHVLDDFGATSDGATVSLSDVAVEELRLSAFEDGYQAGWDDSVRSQSEDGRRITADLAQNLQDLHFTYEEAYCAIMASLRPLFQEMLSSVLPRLARETLAPRLVETLHDLARLHGRQPVEITASPADLPMLGTIITAPGDLDVSLAADDTLARGQVHLRFGHSEHEIDLPEVLGEIESAVSGFFEQTRRTSA